MKKSTKRFVLSEQTTKNLYGFTVLTDGIDLTDFDANPVMLFGHDYTKVIGQWTDYRKENNQLTGIPMFDEDDPEAMKFYSKVEQGILKGASVGISPIEYDEASSEMKRCSLKEASLTPVPANRKAIALYNANGQKLSASEAKEFLLSLKPVQTPDLTKNNIMNQNLINALVALCVQAGHTVNLSAQSTDAEVELSLKKVGESFTSLNSKNVELSGKVKTYEDAAKASVQNEIDTLVAGAIADKRLSADQKEAFTSLGLVNLAALKTSLSAMKPVSVVKVPGAEEKVEDAGHDSWTYDQFALSAPDELATIQRKDPERFQKLLSAKQQAVRAGGSIAL